MSISPHKTPNSKSKRSSQKQQKKQSIQKQQLKQIILKNQNPSQKGYYTIEQWKQLHSLLFTLTQTHITSTIINSWRILKLINFGDDFVPTGLVYDTIMTLINVDQTVEQTQYLLKSIFFKFIQFNGKSLSKQQKDQLEFFKIIKNIVEGYRKIITDNLDLENNLNQQEKSIKDRNQQLYKLYPVMVYKKNLEKLKKIQSEFKSCTFQPQINQYSAEIGQSRYKSIKKKIVIKNQNEFGSIDQSQQFNPTSTFKATPIPNYPSTTPAGLTDHLQRMTRSRQILRINSLHSSSRHPPPSSTQQFSITHRQQQRKLNKLSNCRILFMIKVQVGKRIYRVKVRQNMQIKQTVDAIQKMVGFKNNQIENVVKGYFYNYQKRQQMKKNIKVMNSNNGQKYNTSSNDDCISIVQ